LAEQDQIQPTSRGHRTREQLLDAEADIIRKEAPGPRIAQRGVAENS